MGVMAGGSAPRASRESEPPPSGDERDGGDDAPASTSGANRRSAQRVDVMWSVDCSTEDTFLYASIANISAIGIFVRTESPLEPGTELTLRFSPRGTSEPQQVDGVDLAGDLVLRGSVQWVNRVRPGGDNPNPGMGIRFLELAPAERERLVEAVRSIAYLREEATN
jgi:type IV pilus assembly protein PilZ